MTGSVMDAEDIVQEAFVAYGQLPDPGDIRNERAFLYKIVTNRCLDLLRSSARQRELYVGPWLPEPLMDDASAASEDPSEAYMRRESLSTAYLLLLQQLGAVERAVFLLREIFGYAYDEIAGMVGKSEANCRQIYRRARGSIHYDPSRSPAVDVADRQIKRFVGALAQGDTGTLLELLSDNVVFLSDGGGKVMAAQKPVAGVRAVAQLLQNLLRMYEGKFTLSFHNVNGLPGIRLVVEERLQYIYSFDFAGEQIGNIYAIANPDKLKHVPIEDRDLP